MFLTPFYDAGDPSGAVAQYRILVDRVERAAERSGLAEYAFACRRLLDLLRQQGDLRGALAYGERLLPLFPASGELRLELADLCRELGNPGQERRYRDEAALLGSTPPAGASPR